MATKTFKDHVIEAITRIPRGSVVSYGQVAAAVGVPRGARQVGWVLRTLPADTRIPWWRVVNNQGYLSIKGNWENTKERQKLLLAQEGVPVGEDFTLDIEKYRYTFI